MNNPYFYPVKQEEERIEKLKKDISPQELSKMDIFDFKNLEKK